MGGQPTTRLQVSGHRFLVHRMEHALVRGDVRMLDDPLRAQSLSLIAGAVLAAVGVAVCAVLALVRPGGALGDAPIVVVRESGAMYVRIDDTVHPVFNLASARLIVGSAAEPRLVSQNAVDTVRRGPRVGIADAPERISRPLTAAESQWMVCDSTDTGTTVMAGPVDDETLTEQAVLVTAAGAGAASTYLLYDGHRARVDLRHLAVVRALKIDGVTPRSISAALLAAIPEAPAITPPHIPGAGSAGPPSVGRYPVGTVVTSRRADGGVGYFVVLADGVQQIGEVTADLIRYTDSHVDAGIPALPPAAIGTLPVVDTLPVSTFPDHGGVSAAPVVCARWQARSGSTVLVGEVIPSRDSAIDLPHSDGTGPAVDAVGVPPGRSVFARSSGLTGDGTGSGPLFLVTELGVRYGVRDDAAATSLGLTEPQSIPWPMLAVLPQGPELSRDGASIAGDSAAPT